MTVTSLITFRVSQIMHANAQKTYRLGKIVTPGRLSHWLESDQVSLKNSSRPRVQRTPPVGAILKCIWCFLKLQVILHTCRYIPERRESRVNSIISKMIIFKCRTGLGDTLNLFHISLVKSEVSLENFIFLPPPAVPRPRLFINRPGAKKKTPTPVKTPRVAYKTYHFREG